MQGIRSLFTSVFLAVLSARLSSAQLTKTVGPTTPLSEKTNICNVLDYGGEIGSSDIGPAILEAFTDCVQKTSGSTLYVPAGDYDMETWVTLDDGQHWAFRLDGLITRTSTTGGNMIFIENAVDFEMYSSNSAGGIQGLGYQDRANGPRLLRVQSSTSFSVHDLLFIDSPEYHVTVDTGEQGELYNIVVRAGFVGATDGFDIWGDNIWVHDVEVSNGDECVTVKSPATNILVENVWCNQSGGSAMGSLCTDTAIENILYQYVYTNGGNQAYMIKSWGGSGYVTNAVFDHFLVHNTAYGLDINQYWSSQTECSGDGVVLTDITFSNWDGYVANGVERPPIQLLCADGAPCTSVTLEDVYMWSATDEAVYKCESAYGSGISCIKDSGSASYTSSYTATTSPAGYTAPSTMAGDFATALNPSSSVAVPTAIPTEFYPGRAAISALMVKQGTAALTANGVRNTSM